GGESTGAMPRPGKPLQATSAESCDACHCYVKIFAQEKAPEAEPFADDLASLALDLMMNEAGYTRPHPHPFLWPSTSDRSDA
ncbi:MAG TPA: formate dehydrogenase accessory protein FdhE, partial [Pararobbsia sp.]|nr:formate dehydrogenase accessory protein FdhE [Pararobbsia sp.]